MTYPGTEWLVDSVENFTDGDTLRVDRSRITQLGDEWFRIVDVSPVTGQRMSVPIRLVWVDTPEKKDRAGWQRAKDDLTAWVADHAPGGLRVVCYKSGGFDRILGDLLDSDGNSASQWLMTERGWPAYKKGS
jgi:endonuclease YncB( thermonuclease family)